MQRFVRGGCLWSERREWRILKAIERPAAVHLDICNSVNNSRGLYNNTGFIRHTFDLLHDYIVTLHLKDICLKPNSGTAMFEAML